jgi:hypothetical protein
MLFVADADFPAARPNRFRQWLDLGITDELSILKFPQQATRLRSGFIGKWRALDFAVQPRQWFRLWFLLGLLLGHIPTCSKPGPLGRLYFTRSRQTMSRHLNSRLHPKKD